MVLSSSFEVLVVIVNVVLGMSNVKILQDFLIPWITGLYDTTQGMFVQDSLHRLTDQGRSRLPAVDDAVVRFFKDSWPSSQGRSQDFRLGGGGKLRGALRYPPPKIEN